MATLAIKGHKIRGKEVIDIFNMFGGKDIGYSGFCSAYFYYIDEYGNITGTTNLPKDIIYSVLTLEKFIEKYPYKVGDKVKISSSNDNYAGTIISMRWDDGYNEVIYTVKWDDIINSVLSYRVQDLQPYKEQEPMEEQKLIPPYMDYDVRTYKMNPAEMDGEQFIVPIPKGYEFVGVDNQQVVFEKVKPQYPKSYEECCDILQLESKFILSELTITEEITIKPFIQLKRCRDAYWKLADWSFKIGNHDNSTVYAITIFGNGIIKDFYHALNCNRILVFPTEEMRDVFYDNFRELIEKCKELL